MHVGCDSHAYHPPPGRKSHPPLARQLAQPGPPLNPRRVAARTTTKRRGGDGGVSGRVRTWPEGARGRQGVSRVSAFDFQTTHPHMQDAVSAPSLPAAPTAPSTGFNRYVKLGERPLGKGAYGEVFKVGHAPWPASLLPPPCLRYHHRLVRLHHSPPPLAQTLTPLSTPLCQVRDTVTGETCVLKRVSLCDSDATGGRLPLPVHSTWFADQRRRGNPGGETPATACGHTAAHVASPLTPPYTWVQTPVLLQSTRRPEPPPPLSQPLPIREHHPHGKDGW